MNQDFSVFIGLKSLVNLNFNHLTDLVCDLNLLILKSINLVPHCVTHFRYLASNCYFLSGPSKLFLLDPAVNAPDLGFEVVLQLLNRLILSLKLSSHYRVHLVVTVTQLLSLVPALLLVHFILHVHSVLHVVDGSRALFLL